MRFSNTIKLISVTNSANNIGDPIEAETEREVPAEEESVRQSEFYQAAATGLRPEKVFKMWSGEYNNEPKLEHNGVTYTIIRTFTSVKDKRIIELICQGIVNGVS